MAAWICPDCKRDFGRSNQSLECAPGMSEAEYFAAGSAFERPVYAAVAEHLETVGPLKIEYLSVGIFFKRARTFAELRPMRNRVRLSVLLSRRLQHPRIVKAYHGTGLRSAYFVDLREAARPASSKDCERVDG